MSHKRMYTFFSCRMKSKYEALRTQERKDFKERCKKLLAPKGKVACSQCNQPEVWSLVKRRAPRGSSYTRQNVYVSNIEAHHIQPLSEKRTLDDLYLSHIKAPKNDRDKRIMQRELCIYAKQHLRLLCRTCHKKLHDTMKSSTFCFIDVHIYDIYTTCFYSLLFMYS